MRVPRSVLPVLIAVLVCGPVRAQDDELPTTWRPPNGNVALLTDYGEQDFYVGALKGAILTACPSARIIDISHEVPAYDVRLAAFELWDAAREFPDGTVFVAIVDPGVGTSRRPVILQTAKGNWFVGPDNGIFTIVEREMGPSVYRKITNREWMRPGAISTTFHGRDIFGPAAGDLSCGDPFADVGPIVNDPVRLDLPRVRWEGATLLGEVLFADRYGNLQTNITRASFDSLGVAAGRSVRVEIAGRGETVPFVTAYGEVPVGSPLILVASTDRVEIARNQANAAEYFAARPGSSVRLEPAR
jgi:S-adenosyl-L-methionine hydrolase (adenosine-forming)